jgi:hypothetical protein
MKADGDNDDGEYGDHGQNWLNDENGFEQCSGDDCRSDVRG